ncbi:MAG: mechanosensitive ion channel [Bacteroidales bacterium]|nr:mechanosensitive ion channel [Bacteroidales bacterium]
MRARKVILSALLTVAFLLIPSGRSSAVFNERDLAKTLQVLRYELAKSYTDITSSQVGFEMQQVKQHEQLIELVKSCNELSLMLYSQKQDFTFDLTYALRQVTDQYNGFTQTKLPFDNIMSYFDVEIDRYDRLLKALKVLPPELIQVPDSLGPSLLGALAMTLHIAPLTDFTATSDEGKDVDDLKEETPKFDFQLDSLSQVDRDSCIFYATQLLGMFTDLRDKMVEDKSYYTSTDHRLREAYDYAQSRYKLVQKRIFVEGQRNYWYVLTHFGQFAKRAFADFKDKYTNDFLGPGVKSEWRGPKVLGFSFIILVYLALASLISWLLIRGLKRRLRIFNTERFATREMAFMLLASVILFVLIVLLARGSTRIGTHFYLMASSLIVEFALLLIAILLSMLIRFDGEQINPGLNVYMPVMLLGLLIIAFRIIFIPNSMINLLFPPVLLVFALWQSMTFKKNFSKIPKIDRDLASVSIFVTIAILVLSVIGYVLLGLQLYIWWIFQLTVLQFISAIKELVRKYHQKKVGIRVRAYRFKHPAEIGSEKGTSFLVTWLYDLLEMVIIPVLILLSIPCCLFLASRVFDLTEICKTALFYPFLNTSAITLSLYKVLLAVGLFFVFRYIEYAACSIYRVFKIRDTVAKSGTGLLRDNEVNLTLANNVIWLVTWGLYIVVMIGILRIPTKSLSVVAAGLAAGLGFALKDILNNFFYGVQLMSGRVRVGDTLECDGIRGTVENISYQTTVIRAVDGSMIAFPNATLFSKTFKNLTKSDSYEFISLPVGVAYGTDVEKARKAIIKALKPLCKPDKFGRATVKTSYGIQVTVTGFGDSSVDLVVKQFVLVDQRYSYIAKANESIYKALADNGIEIPFPQRDVYIKHLPETVEKQ